MDFDGIFKIIQVYERYDGANKMQIEQHLSYSSNCSIFSAEKLETTSTTYEETTELEKWQSEISPEY